MSADTGAVDAAVIESVARSIYETIPMTYSSGEAMTWEEVNERIPFHAEKFRTRASAAIQSYQRANAERVTALVDAYGEAAFNIGNVSASFSADEPEAQWAIKADDAARAALLLAVVGEVGM